VIDDEGEVLARAPGFEEELLVVDIDPVPIDRAAAARRAPARARKRERDAAPCGRR
jgi:predicted amidohydrolase